MSIFEPQALECPACQGPMEVSAVDSVNADRRADLRAAILDRSFQVMGCPKCQKEFRLDPVFNYLDVGRGQWLSVQPLGRLESWIETEDEAKATFSQAYGAQAPGPAKAIGDTLRVRLVFGWAALREKLTVADLGLDDVAVEMMKLALIQGLPDVPLREGTELRLVAAEGDLLILNWINSVSDEIVEQMRVPRAMYDGIVNDPESWAPIRKSLEEGPFVDTQKLYFGPGRAAVA